MGKGSKRKRRGTTCEDTIDITLSDIANARTSIKVNYTVDKVSQDHRRVYSEAYTTRVRSEDNAASYSARDGEQSLGDFINDLSTIDVEGLQCEQGKHRRKEDSRKKRYISSVSKGLHKTLNPWH